MLAAAALAALMPERAAAQEIQLDGIVVTFSRTLETAIDALAGSSTVGKEQLDQQFQADRVGDILNTIPGVATSETARDTAQAINIRGLQDFGRVNVLIEGARQNFQRSGHNANGVFYIEPEMLERVDITRGPTATIYGSGAIGGVASFGLINADSILRPGEYAAVQSRTRYSTNGVGWMESGTGAMRIGNFDIVGQLNGRWGGSYEDGHGIKIADSGEETRSGMVKSRWRPAAGHEITGTIIDYHSQFTDRPTGDSPTRRDTELENQQFTLGYTFKRPDTPLLDFSAKVYRNATDLRQVRLDSGSFFEPAGSTRSFSIVTTGFDIYNTSRFEFGAAKLSFTYGVDGFEDKVETSDPNGNGDELTPGGRRTVHGAFIQSQLKLWSIVDVIGALRYDSYELTDGVNSLDGDRVSPKITVGVTPIKGMTFYGTYAEGYRAPAVTETLIAGFHPPPFSFTLLPNPNLRPEVAHTIEGGVNLKYDGVITTGDAFRAKFAVYKNEVDDYIGAVYSPFPPPFGQYQYQNITSATLEGIELEAMYDARTWFLGVGAHRIRGTDDSTGEGLVTVPADQITVTAGVRLMEKKLIAGARVRFVSEQTRLPAGVPPAESYELVDLFGQYILTDQITLNLNVNNLFDVAYRPHLAQSNDPGFAARMGVTVRFGAK